MHVLRPLSVINRVDICDEVNTSDESKKNEFHSLYPTITLADLSMLLRMFRFYALWIPFFEVRVLPWQSLLKQGHEEGVGEAVQYYIICGIYRIQGRQRWWGLVQGGYWDQALRTGRSRRQTRMEGGIWVDEWLGGRWYVTLSFFFIVSFRCEINGSMIEEWKLKDIYNGLLKL